MSQETIIIGSNSKKGIDDIFQTFGQRHICNIYRNRTEQFFLIADFLYDGLKKGKKCVYIVDENTKEGVLSSLKERGARADDPLLEKLVFLTKEESYLVGGSFDPDRMIDLLKEAQEKALAEGYPALRVTGEMTWVFSKLPGVEKLLEYEAKLNYFFPGSKTMAICQYNENKFDAKTLMGVLNTHPVVGIYGELYENPYYIPPDLFLATMNGEVPVNLYEKARDDVIKRMSAERARRNAENALVQTNNKLTVLSNLTGHDMSNKLSIIMGACALARERNVNPDMLKFIDMITKAGTAIQAQLEFAKTYREIGTKEPKWIDIGSIVTSEIVGFDLSSISVVNDIANINVLADTMIGKVLHNLVDNSIRHGEHVKKIQFSTEVSSENLVISYEDDGIGIKDEEKEMIFKRGFGKNTGLGLYLCREVLSLTGASIKETGKFMSGARFEMVFPPHHWVQT